MWNGNNDSIAPHASKNYMYGGNVFILDEITSENCAYLIGDLTRYATDQENYGKNLLFMINSPGGEVNTMIQIIGLMNMARINGIGILTFVLGMAGSAASVLAVQGDQRYMNNISKHFVHFGCIWDITSKQSEIEKIYKQNKEYALSMNNLYLDACKGKLTNEQLLFIQSDERGFLSAQQCMKYGLCDAIIEDELLIKQKDDAEREEFESTFDAFIKNKYKKPSKTKSSKRKVKKK